MKLMAIFFIIFSSSLFAEVDRFDLLKDRYILVKEDKDVLKNIIEISYIKKCISLDMIDEKKDLINEFGKFYSFYKKYEDEAYLNKRKKYLTLDIYKNKIEIPMTSLRIICEKI